MVLSPNGDSPATIEGDTPTSQLIYDKMVERRWNLQFAQRRTASSQSQADNLVATLTNYQSVLDTIKALIDAFNVLRDDFQELKDNADKEDAKHTERRVTPDFTGVE